MQWDVYSFLLNTCKKDQFLIQIGEKSIVGLNGSCSVNKKSSCFCNKKINVGIRIDGCTSKPEIFSLEGTNVSPELLLSETQYDHIETLSANSAWRCDANKQPKTVFVVCKRPFRCFRVFLTSSNNYGPIGVHIVHHYYYCNIYSIYFLFSSIVSRVQQMEWYWL